MIAECRISYQNAEYDCRMQNIITWRVIRLQGVAYYIFENVKTPEELKITIARCEQIADMRVILWEDPEYDNSLLSEKEAEERHYKVVKPRIEENLKNFCKTMGFSMFTD